MRKCEHGRWPGEYCDPCEALAQDEYEAWAARLSHDQTPMLPASGRY